MSENVITRFERIDDLPAGQWVVAADGAKACMFDTHMGFPQRMWGMKAGGGTKGVIRSYVDISQLQMPLQLADIDGDFQCHHAQANECGQCTICGQPEATAAKLVYFEGDGKLFRSAAALNIPLETAK